MSVPPSSPPASRRVPGRLGARALLAVVVALGTIACWTPEWTYSEPNGPDDWGDLTPEWRLARAGLSQSPIDITGARSAEGPALSFEYRGVPLALANEDHTLSVDLDDGGRLILGDEGFALSELHFHAPSEHTVDGVPFAMEAHLVHEADDGSLAIVGVLFEPGAANDFLIPFWNLMPQESGETYADDDMQIDATTLLPAGRASWRYLGSQTRPPCDEGVRWVVLQETVEASPEQIDMLVQTFGRNARSVQPLNARLVVSIE